MNAASTSLIVDSEELLAFCKASADSLRLNIVRALSVESFGVLELCHIFDTTQSGMSHHLKILSRAGLLQTRREGNSIFYRRALIPTDNPISALITSLFDSVDKLTTLPVAIKRRCEEIHRERAQHSREFFQKNADRLKDNQNLIAEFPHYAACITDLLFNEHWEERGTVIEVGPGESDLIDILCTEFESFIAVDNAEEMLDKTREKARLGGYINASFVLGELSDLDHTHKADLIVLNMVLHHLASPHQVFNIATKLLKPGGRLLIADLCSHNQDWTRDACGDLWLGFDPDDLDQWADDAALEKGQSAYLGLRNGFQIQVRLYQSTSLPGSGRADYEKARNEIARNEKPREANESFNKDTSNRTFQLKRDS